MIDVSLLRTLLRYDHKAGALYWKKRDRELFTSDRIWLGWNAKHIGKPAFTALNCGYPHGTIFSKKYLAHRVAWAIYHGSWPADFIDHINGNLADYRICNLRDVSRAGNAQNAKRYACNSTGVTGVYRHGQNDTWTVRIGRKYISSHLNFDDAVAARKSAEVELGYHPNHGRATS